MKIKQKNVKTRASFAYSTFEPTRASIAEALSVFLPSNLQFNFDTQIHFHINPFTFFNHSNSPINKEPSTHNHANSFRTHCTQSFSHPRSSLTSLRRRRLRRDPPAPSLRRIRSLAVGEPQGYPHCRR